MKESRSFTEYVKNSLDNQLWKALEDYLETADPSELDLRLSKVRDPGQLELYDTDLQFVNVSDLPGSMIAFTVVTDATLIVHDIDQYHNDETDCAHQWFVLKCTGDLDKHLNDMTVNAITVYSGHERRHRRLSDSLVPIMRKEDLEQVADEFLTKYYPEARRQPMWIDPMELAKRMDLTVICHTISAEGTVFGQIYFREAEATLYDEKTKRSIKQPVRPRTIIVDPNVAFQRNLGAYNNTIVHECVHWEYHKKAFALEQLFNEDASRIRCKVVGGIAGKSDDGTKWMEWQANSLAPKIQMPLQQFKRKAAEYIKAARNELGITELCDLMPPVIDELAAFFAVSRMAAKIRLITAGYEEAAGAFTYIDGHYIKPYTYARGSLEQNQTYSVSLKDAVILSVANSSFHEKTQDGSYIYVDSHFVLNHPKYLRYDASGNLQMTDYARYHANECCIAFDISLKTDVDCHYHTECFLNRDENTPFDFIMTFDDGIDDKQKIKMLGDTVIEQAAFLRSLPNDFCQAMQKCMDWRKMSNADLARATGITDRTIGRILNGQTQGDLVNIVLMCLGLHLPPTISHFIIGLTPHNFVYSNPDCVWYEFALTHLYTRSVDEIRTILHGQGCMNI